MDNQTRKTIKKLKDQRDEALLEIESLNQQLDDTNKRISALSEEISTKTEAKATAEISKLESELRESAIVLATLQSDRLKLDRELEVLVAERDSALEAADKSAKIAKQFEARIDELLKINEDADIKRYQKRVREKSEEVDRLRSQLKQTEGECRALALIAQKLQAEVVWLQGARKAELPSVEDIQKAMAAGKSATPETTP